MSDLNVAAAGGVNMTSGETHRAIAEELINWEANGARVHFDTTPIEAFQIANLIFVAISPQETQGEMRAMGLSFINSIKALLPPKSRGYLEFLVGNLK